MNFRWVVLLCAVCWCSGGVSDSAFAQNDVRTLEDVRREAANSLSIQNFSIVRENGIVGIPHLRVKEWIENHPYYIAKMSEPDSSQKRLFILLTNMAKGMVNKTLSSGQQFFVLPGKNDDEAFFVALVYAAEMFQGGNENLNDSRLIGQLEALNAAAKDLGATPSANIRSKIEITQRFVLASIALGFDKREDIANWSSKFKFEDFMISRDRVIAAKSEIKLPFSVILSQMHIAHVPVIAGEKMQGIWRQWEAFDANIFLTDAPEKKVFSPMEMLLAQQYTTKKTETRQNQRIKFANEVMKKFSPGRALGKKAPPPGSSKEEVVISLAKLQLEEDLPTLSDWKERAKAKGLDLAFLNNADFERIYLECVGIAAEVINSLDRETIATERKASGTRESLEAASFKVGTKKEDEHFFFDTDAQKLILEGIVKSVSLGEMPAFKSIATTEIELKKEIVAYLYLNFPAFSKHVPSIQNHLASLKVLGSRHLNKKLDAEEEAEIENLFREVLALHIANQTSEMLEAAAELKPAAIEIAEDYGLIAQDSFNPWDPIYGIAPISLEGTEHSSAAFRDKIAGLGIDTKELIKKLGNGILFERIHEIMTDLPKEYDRATGLNGIGEAWKPGKGGWKKEYGPVYFERMQKMATIFVMAKPKDAKEFAAYFRDPSRMKPYITKPPRYFYTDSLFEGVFEFFSAELKGIVITQGCDAALKAAQAALAPPAK